MPRIIFLTLFVVCICLIACETPSFAADTDRAAAVLKRELGVTITGGDGSSFEKAIIVHAPNVETTTVAVWEYIALRYRVWQLRQWALVNRKHKFYLVMTYNYDVALGPFPNRKTRVFYFDMTNYYVGKRPQASKQSMKSTAPLRNKFSVFATRPCRSLSLSR
jgi:hypothetical protein